jgi:secreted PhoX family phosphatase
MLMSNLQKRRQFLKFVSCHTALWSVSPLIYQSLVGCSTTTQGEDFTGLQPTLDDGLHLAPGINYHIISRWGDLINSRGEVFGFNNDFTCFLPLKGKSDEGLLWVNHESVIPQFLHNRETNKLTRSKSEIIKEQEAVGGSILHLKRAGGRWALNQNSKYNRRINGRTRIPFSHKQSIQGDRTALGTIANCAGGLTPWGTFLTSEENYDDFYGEAILTNGERQVTTKDKFNWWKHFPQPPEHYGWVVEINPLTGVAEKQVLLGRAPHEGATVVSTQNHKAVVYMGEDREGGYLFKFVGDRLSLQSGTLYAADTVNGRWIALDHDKSRALQKVFKNQWQVLTYAHQAAAIVGATPQDRPEDIEVHPRTGDVFVALTKNSQANNPYGSLLKIVEKDDHDSTSFSASTWISGGPQSGVACPDNMCFDKNGNLWVTNDISEKEINKGPYKGFGNNGLFFVPMSGPQA